MKTLLKKGDEFIPIKPKNRFESPTWPEDMDILNNTLQIVKDISPTGFIISETNFSFHPDWCTKVEPVMHAQILSGKLDLFAHDGWCIEGTFDKQLNIAFKGIISIEDNEIYILSNELDGIYAQDLKGFKYSFRVTEKGKIVYDYLDYLTINSIISPKVEPMKAGLETITDTHIASTHKVTDKEVDIQIQKLKEVINPDPYKIFEGSISDDETDAKEYERVKWEVRRYELAKAAMQGIIVNATSFDYVAELVRESIDFADEMIRQLKGEYYEI